MQNSLKSPPIELCGLINDYLYRAWEKGWFSSYSEDHFLLKALDGVPDLFTGYVNMLAIASGPLEHNLSSVRSSFYQALSNSLNIFENAFSEKDAKEFVVNKLSGGKANYDENQFMQALSELTVIRWFCLYTKGKEKNSVFCEPKLCLSPSI